MRPIRRQVTSAGWAAPTRVLMRASAGSRRALVGAIPRAKVEDVTLAAPLAAAPRALIVAVPKAILEDRYDGYYPPGP